MVRPNLFTLVAIFQHNINNVAGSFEPLLQRDDIAFIEGFDTGHFLLQERVTFAHRLLPEKDRFDELVRARLSKPLLDHGAMSERLEVVTTSLGSWSPTPDCETPRLWLLIHGDHAMLQRTAKGSVQMAQNASGGCFLAIAVMVGQDKDKKVHNSLLELQHGAFGGRLSFAIVNKAATFKQLQLPLALPQASSWFVPMGGGSSLFSGMVRIAHRVDNAEHVASQAGAHVTDDHIWYALAVCAEAAAEVLPLTASPSAAVLRLRSDVQVAGSTLELSGVTKYFRDGQRGHHLMFTGSPHGANAILLTSYEGYKNDIGLAYEQIPEIARSNGRGLGWASAGGSHAILACTYRPKNEQESPCLMTAMEVGVPWSILKENQVLPGSVARVSAVINPAQVAHLRCPAEQPGFTEINQVHQHGSQWNVLLEVKQSTGPRFFRSSTTVSLVSDGSVMEAWPTGC